MRIRAGALVTSAALAATLGAVPSSAGQPGQAQPAQPAPPPRSARPPSMRETRETTLEGRKVSIEYGRPALKGRTIDELLGKLREDRIWRAGDNQVTTLSTEGDILIGDKRVPAGKYSLYVYAPAQGDWALVVNRDPGIALKQLSPAAPPELAEALWPRLDGYAKVADKEVARITLMPARPAEPTERFLITLEPPKDGVSAVTLAWGDRAWTVGLRPARP